MVASVSTIKSLGVVALAKLIIYKLRGSYDTTIDKPPPPPTQECGNYCIKAQCELKDKKTGKLKRTYKGYSKSPNISKRVETICDVTSKNSGDYCTKPDITFSRHLTMCKGQVEIHYEGTDIITII
jgi:hypothetical protein